jgi:hypothetical protein
MSFLGGAAKPMTRRGLLRCAGAVTAIGVVVSPSLAFAAGAVIDVTASPYSADPSKADNSAAFQAALNAIAANGGGKLYVPGGNYVLASPLVYTGGSLTVTGDGQSSSVLINTHSGIAFQANLVDASKCLTMRDLGFSPCLAGVARRAISVNVPLQPSGWQNVLIENVCIGVPYATGGNQYTSYNNAIYLVNTTRARMSNVNVHGNGPAIGTAVALAGTCYDTRVLGCTLEGYAYGVGVLSYCEGLHLANNVIICGTAVTTGGSNYNTGPVPINLLELFMTDCEVNTGLECMFLYQVKNAQINNCHFTGPKAASGGAAIDMRGCSESLVSNSTFCGGWAPGAASVAGIAFNPSSRAPTVSCHVSDVQFENMAVGVYFGAGAQANTVTDVQLMTPGCGGLVNGVSGDGNQVLQQVVVDVSGNTTNNAAWVTSANTISAVTGRRISSQH